MQINNRTYIFFRIAASLILLSALFMTYIGTMWFFDKLTLFEKLFGFTYIILLLSLIIVRPRKSRVYFLIIIVSSLPAFYSLSRGMIDYSKSIDIFLPLSVILALSILFLLSKCSLEK